MSPKATRAQLEQQLADARLSIKNLERLVYDLKQSQFASQLPPSPPASPPPSRALDSSDSPLQATSPRVFAPLTQEEKDHCIQLNICFRCRQHGHSSYHGSCPNTNWRQPHSQAQSDESPASASASKEPSALKRPRRPRGSARTPRTTLKEQIDQLTARLDVLQPPPPVDNSLFEAVAQGKSAPLLDERERQAAVLPWRQRSSSPSLPSAALTKTTPPVNNAIAPAARTRTRSPPVPPKPSRLTRSQHVNPQELEAME